MAVMPVLGDSMRSSFVLAGLSLVLVMSCTLDAQCRFAKSAAQTAITYRFQPESGSDGLLLHITMEFNSGANGTQTLLLPTHWAGESLHSIANLHVISQGASLADTPGSNSKTVHAKPDRLIRVDYDLQKDWAGPLIHPMQFHPVLMPTYMEFTGSNALVALDVDRNARETANFDWKKLPVSWSLATSFGDTTTTNNRCQSFTGTRLQINDGLYAAGDFRIHHFQIGRRPAVLAIRGSWSYKDDEAVGQIQKVVGLVRDFWHEDDFPYFLVTLQPYDQDHGSSDGSAFTNAFWVYVSRLDSFAGLLPQLAHESFHAWNPFRMGVQGSNTDYAETNWFKEGFTEYYAQLLTYRAGVSPPSSYISSINRDLRTFPISTSEYVRGRIIALWLDGTIRHESNGLHTLDDVMFDMERDSDQPYTLARILDTAGRYLSPESQALLQKAAASHGDLVPPTSIPLMSDCTHASLQELPTYDGGFDINHSRVSGTVVGVVEGGPAFAAGIRNGQKLVGISINKGNSERLAKVTIRSENEEKQISFYPRGKTVMAWQYEPGDSACSSH
jgi:predicted metalloprotease with PDZ domain